jgi:ribonuclease M5
MRPYQISKSDVTHAFLHDLELTGHYESKKRRMMLTKVLHIGYVNGKTLYQRLHLFGITQKEIVEVFK